MVVNAMRKRVLIVIGAAFVSFSLVIFSGVLKVPDSDQKHEQCSSVTFLGHPLSVVSFLESHYEWLDTISVSSDPQESALERARFAYLELVRGHVSGLAYLDAEKSVAPQLHLDKARVGRLDTGKRNQGSDWTYLGYTMTGSARLNALRKLLIEVFANKVPGHFMETGVWRGGSSMYAKAVIDVYGESERKVYLFDSFQGLPPGNSLYDSRDVGWDHTKYLEVSVEHVKNFFSSLNLLDKNVEFVKGFFSESIPEFKKNLGAHDMFAILRLDGDLYESTVDVLYHMYDHLSIGGYVIMDDWFGFPSKKACEDFFQAHGISPEIFPIDGHSIYWQKNEEIEIQFWRYKQKTFV